jgi:hypothetical protein
MLTAHLRSSVVKFSIVIKCWCEFLDCPMSVNMWKTKKKTVKNQIWLSHRKYTQLAHSDMDDVIRKTYARFSNSYYCMVIFNIMSTVLLINFILRYSKFNGVHLELLTSVDPHHLFIKIVNLWTWNRKDSQVASEK